MPKRKNNKKSVSNKNKNKNKIIININSNNKKKVINSKKNNAPIPTNQPILISNPAPQPQYLQPQANPYANALSSNEFGIGVNKLLDALKGGTTRITENNDQNAQDAFNNQVAQEEIKEMVQQREKEIRSATQMKHLEELYGPTSPIFNMSNPYIPYEDMATVRRRMSILEERNLTPQTTNHLESKNQLEPVKGLPYEDIRKPDRKAYDKARYETFNYLFNDFNEYGGDLQMLTTNKNGNFGANKENKTVMMDYLRGVLGPEKVEEKHKSVTKAKGKQKR